MNCPRTLNILVALSLAFAQAAPALACTGLRVKPRDGSIVTGRTLEFPTELHSSVVVIPRGMAYTGSAPGGLPGLRWTTKYGMVGANGVGKPVIIDGLNEKGLGIGIFYFSNSAGYPTVAAGDAARTLAPWELPTFLLGTCSNVAEAAEAAGKVVVGPTALTEWGIVPPVHYVLHDASGRSVVLEPVGGKLLAHENPIGVMANNPTFDWHMTNLQNYVNLTVSDAPGAHLDGEQIPRVDIGTGMLGLPGNFTSPSRFVRAVAYSQSAIPVDDAREGVLQAFHLLNQFDMPRGLNREHRASPDMPRGEAGAMQTEYTLWTSVSDLKNRRFYFHTYANRQIRMVDLASFDLDAKAVRTLPMTAPQEIEAMGGAAKPAVAAAP